MTTTSSTPRRPRSSFPLSWSERIQGRLAAAKVNGGAACAEPRGNGCFTVTGRSGARYTVRVLDRETIFCDCRSGLFHGPSSCWHAAACFLRTIADGAVSAC